MRAFSSITAFNEKCVISDVKRLQAVVICRFCTELIIGKAIIISESILFVER